MRPAEIYLAALPQADGMKKLRPVVILARFCKHGDFRVCGVSTQLQSADPDVDLVFEADSEDFVESGLRQTSVLRLSHLFTIPKESLRGRIGVLPGERFHQLGQRLVQFLG